MGWLSKLIQPVDDLYTLDLELHFKIPERFRHKIMECKHLHYDISVGSAVLRGIEFHDQDTGELRLRITANGVIQCLSGYKSDGCSPKVRIGGVVVGVWDGWINPETGLPIAYPASVLHDLLLQFMDCPNMPFDNKDIDELFAWVLRKDGFWLWPAYFAGVRLFSGAIHRRGKYYKRCNESV